MAISAVLSVEEASITTTSSTKSIADDRSEERRVGKELREDVKKKIKDLERLLAEKELDKKAKKMMGELSEEAKFWYEKAKTWLIEELASLKKGIENINWQDYQKAVTKIISRLKKEVKKGGKEIETIRKRLLKNWQKMKKEGKSE